VEDVAARLDRLRRRIAEAVEGSGRTPQSVHLLAVSKAQPPAAIEAAYQAGQRDFGESYVQELVAKAEALAHLEKLRWHFVGHLQTNKVKLVAGLIRSIHSVDSVRLVAEIEKRRAAWRNAAAGRERLEAFIEVNVGREPQKHGALPEAAGAVLDALERSSALEAVGLMTVPPHTDDPDGALPFFRALAELRERLGGAKRLPELSIGMSHDLEPAIATGATWVRVGTAIFGARARTQ
jgi:hypothetical protein